MTDRDGNPAADVRAAEGSSPGPVPQLPATVRGLLDGGNLEAAIGHTFPLLTVDADGSPRVSLLSAGEVYAPTPDEIRLAMWPKSRSTANVNRAGKATLCVVADGAMFYVRLDVRERGSLDKLAYFRSSVEEVHKDVVGYARLTSGMTFELVDREATLARWSAVVDGMRRKTSG